MLKINMIIVPIVLLALFSCKRESKFKLEYISTYCSQIDSVHLNVKNIKTFSIINFNEKPTAFYFNESDSSINFHVLEAEKGKISNTKYYLNDVLQKSILDPYSEWLVVNKDTLFAISMLNKSVYMFNTNDQVIDSFPLFTTDNKANYVCFSCTMSSMKYNIQNLVIPVNSNVVYDEINNEYFSMAGIVINLKDKSITKFGRHSNEKILDFTAYTNPYDYFDIVKNLIVFSSEEDHSIYTYNTISQETSKFPCKSKYINNIDPFPDSCKFNHDAKTNYTIEHPRYGMIRYCPYSNYYYRLVKHEAHIPESNGLYKPTIPKSKYSLIVIDSSFNLLGEFILNEKNASNFILPTKNGLIFSSTESTFRENSNLCLDLFRIK